MALPIRSIRFFAFAYLLLIFTFKLGLGAEPAPEGLPETVAPRWKAVGKVRVLTGAECLRVPDGEIALEYGLEAIASRNYADGKEHYLVELFELRFPSGAYGFTSFLQNVGKQRAFQSGRRVIRVQRLPNSAPLLPEFFEALVKSFPESKDVPIPLPSHLPQTGKTARSETYFTGPKVLASHRQFNFLKGAVSFDGGTEAVTAEYQLSQAEVNVLLLEFHTPQLAHDGFAKLEAAQAKLPEAEKNQLVFKRIGNYVAVANPVKDKQATEALLGEIKYTAVVHWQGTKFSDIPLEYRPPDPAALEEASETATILLRTFYWIGLMLALAAGFGIITGSSFFYWRRYQRRKAGLDELFSDAGGTIRLNLEDEPLETPESKLLN